MKALRYILFSALVMLTAGCMKAQSADDTASPAETEALPDFDNVLTGADRVDEYLPLLEGKRVGLVVNQTSVVNLGDGWYLPLVDTLLHSGVNVRCIMAPEHGYLGSAGAGKAVPNSTDPRTGLPVLSLYGKTHKPLPQWLSKLDVVVFDLQDVGARFYTYLSTLYYMLQACGEENTEIIVLDRPNPNDTIDGPVLDMKLRSFVGIMPVPLLHGCTLGEMAQMMVGERWIGSHAPKLTVITCRGWNHGDPYTLPIAPSPNLPSMHAIRLYPRLCLFEGTNVSVGRGTDHPFECYGNPYLKGPFEFTPHSTAAATHPMYKDKRCHGVDLRDVRFGVGFHLEYLQAVEKESGVNWVTQPGFFDKLAGTEELRRQLMGGASARRIRDSWQKDLDAYRRMREKYTLYGDPRD